MSTPFALFPQAASSIATRVDQLTWALLGISGLMLLVVFGLILGFGVLYRKDSPRSRKIDLRGGLALEWGWTVATFAIFLGLFAWGAMAYFRMHEPLTNAYEVSVVAKQWMWKFQHPGGKQELDELHIPVGTPVLLTMTSQDVIHSLFIPAFRVKQDVVPSRYTRLWFKATAPGIYHLLCTQYCGLDHAKMGGKVHALGPAEFERWLSTGVSLAEPSMAGRGRQLFTRLGCISCHGPAPGVSPGVRAPSLFGVFGKQVALSNGSQVFADENYLRESILNPAAKIVEGYPAIMPSFTGVATEGDVLDLIAYLKTLNGAPP